MAKNEPQPNPGTEETKPLSAQEKLKALQEEAKALKDQIKKEKEAKKAAKGATAYTRLHSVVAIIRSGEVLSKDEIAAKANTDYIAHGGKDNLTESKGYTDKTLKTMSLLPGLVDLSAEGKYTFHLPPAPEVAAEPTTEEPPVVEPEMEPTNE